MLEFIDKPWGHEEILEKNKDYVVIWKLTLIENIGEIILRSHYAI